MEEILSSKYLKLSALGLGLLILGIIFKPFTIISPGNRGVVVTLGKVEGRVLDEGIHPIWPVINDVKVLNVQVRRNDIEAQAASGDLQDVKTKVAVNWRTSASKVNSIYQNVGGGAEILDRLLIPAVSESVKQATARMRVDDILKKRAELKQEIDAAVKQRLEPYGVVIESISLVDFTFSPEFNKAIEAKQVAEQEAKQAEYLALKAKKEGEAEVNRAKGQAEAQRLQRQTLTRELIQKQAIEKWDGKFPTYMGGGSPLPFIDVTPKN